jgi:hypothetical protein
MYSCTLGNKVGKAIACIVEVVLCTVLACICKTMLLHYAHRPCAEPIDLLWFALCVICVRRICFTWATVQWLRGSASGLSMLLRKDCFEPLTSENVRTTRYDCQAGDVMNYFSPRGFMHATVYIGTQRINLCNTHLNALGSPWQRGLQIDQLIQHAEARIAQDSGICIVGGDFNCGPRSVEIQV